MAQGRGFTTLGELLDENAETQQDEAILERIKILAQESLPKVFALPTVGLVRAFDPEADHLSEKGYREIRFKLLDWAFTRALILGPPSIANRIRGSAARTELFKQSVDGLRPLLHTRYEANKILSGSLSESEKSNRKRRSCSSVFDRSQSQKRRRISPVASTSQDSRIECLEKKMDSMFALLLEKIDTHHQQQTNLAQTREPDSDKENYSDSEEYAGSDSSAGCSWNGPKMDIFSTGPEMSPPTEIEFRPRIKEMDPLIPEPSEPIQKEGIECQRLGSEGWNRIRYKEVEKRLQAASVFSALKVNIELGSLKNQPFPFLAKQEGMLGTISHGLLLQRKALADGLNNIIKKCPDAGDELRKLLADDSQFKVLSDDLLQFVCAHRAEAIEARRRAYKPKNVPLGAALHSIPPSSTHLFDEKRLGTFLRDNGGLAQIFPVLSNRFSERKGNKETFRKPTASHPARGRQQPGRTHLSASSHNASAQPTAYRMSGGSKPSNKQRNRPRRDHKLPKRRSALKDKVLVLADRHRSSGKTGLRVSCNPTWAIAYQASSKGLSKAATASTKSKDCSDVTGTGRLFLYALPRRQRIDTSPKGQAEGTDLKYNRFPPKGKKTSISDLAEA
ncbi:hypothetical protein HW555_003287 [Spodoptera exigua]|uniref:Uncharacterized protein n=1 Tax=Spodoptera exigua TaxID=7107 RepID=A0A835GN80_SPOEX|nr:hypothetical protein HW555_003287 [Spodoptera exigua]